MTQPNNKRKESLQEHTGVLMSGEDRFRLFIGSYGMAVLITVFIVVGELGAGFGGSNGILAVLLATLLIFINFPPGLLGNLGIETFNKMSPYLAAGYVVGYITYGVILILGSTTQKRRVFQVLYIIFALLLVANVRGCAIVAIDMAPRLF